jgi:hypothetical protein
MKLPLRITLALSASALVIGLALVSSTAAQLPDSRTIAQARQFMPVGASNSYAWFIDVHAQQAVACSLQGESSPQARVVCRAGPIP